MSRYALKAVWFLINPVYQIKTIVNAIDRFRKIVERF